MCHIATLPHLPSSLPVSQVYEAELELEIEHMQSLSKVSQRGEVPSKVQLRMSSNSPSRVVAYLPSLSTILQRLRATSTTPSSLGSTLFPSHTPSLPQPTTHTTAASSSDSLHFPTPLLHFQLHPQYPLPGGASIPSLTTPTIQPTDEATNEEPTFLTVIREKPQGTVEMLIQECPPSLLKGFMKLFPSLESKGLTVITLCQRTKNDMTSWSAEVESERDSLLEHFVDSAKEICARLTGANLWADFIEPASGRAFYSAYTHDTLFETDERLRYLGFDIDDLGCCRCVYHPIWGAFAFVGIIFTDASASSPILRSIMEL
ncbi:cobalamin trafficking protein CblD-like [Halichondria panicea]|uniref:cobalamin trafficking protein CblD-like n=1 Tax=Halichondria panicea TaxID=6063 RepID=UPI00312B779D